MSAARLSRGPAHCAECRFDSAYATADTATSGSAFTPGTLSSASNSSGSSAEPPAAAARVAMGSSKRSEGGDESMVPVRVGVSPFIVGSRMRA